MPLSILLFTNYSFQVNFFPLLERKTGKCAKKKKKKDGKEKAKETKRIRQTDGNIIDDWHTAKFDI